MPDVDIIKVEISGDEAKGVEYKVEREIFKSFYAKNIKQEYEKDEMMHKEEDEVNSRQKSSNLERRRARSQPSRSMTLQRERNKPIRTSSLTRSLSSDISPPTLELYRALTSPPLTVDMLPCPVHHLATHPSVLSLSTIITADMSRSVTHYQAKRCRESAIAAWCIALVLIFVIIAATFIKLFY